MKVLALMIFAAIVVFMVVLIVVAILVALTDPLGCGACFLVDFAIGLSLISDFFLMVIRVSPLGFYCFCDIPFLDHLASRSQTAIAFLIMQRDGSSLVGLNGPHRGLHGGLHRSGSGHPGCFDGRVGLRGLLPGELYSRAIAGQ